MVLEIETKTTTIKKVYLQDKNNKQKLTEALEVFDDEFIKEFVKKKVFLLRSIALGLLLLSFLRVYTIIRGKLYAVNDNMKSFFFLLY